MVNWFKGDENRSIISSTIASGAVASLTYPSEMICAGGALLTLSWVDSTPPVSTACLLISSDIDN